MPVGHAVLAILVAARWGINFAAAWLSPGEQPAQADLVGAGVVLTGLLLAARAGATRKIVYESGG